jgi:hypothetical protein
MTTKRSGRRELLHEKVRYLFNRIALEIQITNRRRYAIKLNWLDLDGQNVLPAAFDHCPSNCTAAFEIGPFTLGIVP